MSGFVYISVCLLRVFSFFLFRCRCIDIGDNLKSDGKSCDFEGYIFISSNGENRLIAENETNSTIPIKIDTSGNTEVVEYDYSKNALFLTSILSNGVYTLSLYRKNIPEKILYNGNFVLLFYSLYTTGSLTYQFQILGDWGFLKNEDYLRLEGVSALLDICLSIINNIF